MTSVGPIGIGAVSLAVLCLALPAAAMPLQQAVERAGSVTSGGKAGLPIPDTWRQRTGRTTFVIRIENISPRDAMRHGHGRTWAAGMSHGNYAVFRRGAPLFEPGAPAIPGSGLEELAEDGNVRPLQKHLWHHRDVLEGGIFYMPVGASKDEELWPGKAYEFTITADPGDRLSFATMLMQSNDAFYGPADGGIALYDDAGQPISGDISGLVVLWDAGTEVNQEGGFGPDAGMFQSARNTGPAEREPVRPIDDGYYYPPAPEVLRVTVTPIPAAETG